MKLWKLRRDLYQGARTWATSRAVEKTPFETGNPTPVANAPSASGCCATVARKDDAMKKPDPKLKNAIIAVGYGRGFLVEHAPWPHRVIHGGALPTASPTATPVEL
jgi:hypothetical protein